MKNLTRPLAAFLLLAACHTTVVQSSTSSGAGGTGGIGGGTGTGGTTGNGGPADCGGPCPQGQACYATGVPCYPNYSCDDLPAECAATPTCECVQMNASVLGCTSDADGGVTAIDEAGGDAPDCP